MGIDGSLSQNTFDAGLLRERLPGIRFGIRLLITGCRRGILLATILLSDILFGATLLGGIEVTWAEDR